MAAAARFDVIAAAAAHAVIAVIAIQIVVTVEAVHIVVAKAAVLNIVVSGTREMIVAIGLSAFARIKSRLRHRFRKRHCRVLFCAAADLPRSQSIFGKAPLQPRLKRRIDSQSNHTARALYDTNLNVS
ncbi:MAG: hypothetical protein ABL897_06085 [Hyphomicrobium sp.]